MRRLLAPAVLPVAFLLLFQGPVLDLNFMGGSLPSGVTFSRAQASNFVTDLTTLSTTDQTELVTNGDFALNPLNARQIPFSPSAHLPLLWKCSQATQTADAKTTAAQT